MKKSKTVLKFWWMAVINYRFFFSAILSTLSLSCILFVLALLNDRGKNLNFDRALLDNGHFENGYHGNGINTKLFDDKRTFFDLIDDTEWRLKNERRSNYANFVKSRVKRDLYTERSDDEIKLIVDGDLDCDTVTTMVPTMSFLASGWTKAVYKAKYKSSELAVKIVDITGQDISQCLDIQQLNNNNDGQRIDNKQNVGTDQCYRKAERKIIKEIALLKQLEHPNIIKVLGYCIPKKPDAKDSRRRVAIVTELGEPVNLIRLLQLSWEDRLRIVYSLAQLLKHLAHHDLGSLVMNDMRRQQFVLINGELKLVDVDDIGIEEPKCYHDNDCLDQVANLYANLNEDHVIPKSDNGSLLAPVNCVKGYCKGFNEIRNIFNTARHFTTFLLPYGAPYELQDYVNYIVESFKNLTTNSNQLFNMVDRLVKTYSSGSYLQQNKTFQKSFRKVAKSDLTGVHDYSCQGSRTQISCAMSMFNPEEAGNLCAAQPVCKAFVWTNEKSWTGRNIVYFKNNASVPIHNENVDLYVKSRA